MIRRLGIALLVLAGMAEANAPSHSIRPVSREDVFPPALPSFAPDRSLRPKSRPRGLTTRARPTPPPATAAAAAKPNPYDPLAVAMPARDRDAAATSRRERKPDTKIGKVCRDRKLQGTEVGKVPGKLSGCGISKGAIKLYSVSGVALSRPAVMECDTARALKKWVDGGVNKSVKRFGGGAVELQVAAGYACRTRNNRPGAKISEHGKGRAIDISGVKLKNGDTINVLNDWGRGKKGRILKKMHKEACGPFGTVLGPNSDAYHRDHFHFDVAKHRGGPYCR